MSDRENLEQSIIHYNLGTNYLNKNQFAIARYHLEKAYKLGLSHKDLNHNLQLARNSLLLNEKENLSLTDNVMFWALNTPKGLYLSSTLTILLVTLLAIFFKIIKKKSLMAICVVISLIPLLLSWAYLRTKNFAIVLENATVRNGPSEIFDKKSMAVQGMKIIVTKPRYGWSYLYFPKAQSGWIKSKQIGNYDE